MVDSKKIFRWIRKHSSEIMLGATLISYGFNLYSTVKTTLAVDRVIKEDGSKIEVVKKIIPSALTTCLTISCIIFSYQLNKKKEAALMSAALTGMEFLNSYRSRTQMELGRLQEKEMFNEVYESKVDYDIFSLSDIPVPPTTNETDEGFALFYEPISKSFFYSKPVDVSLAESEANRILILRGDISFREWLILLGVTNDLYDADNMNPVYDGMGWTQIDGDITYGYQWIDFEHKLRSTKDGRDYYLINYPFMPHPMYECDEGDD